MHNFLPKITRYSWYELAGLVGVKIVEAMHRRLSKVFSHHLLAQGSFGKSRPFPSNYTIPDNTTFPLWAATDRERPSGL